METKILAGATVIVGDGRTPIHKAALVIDGERIKQVDIMERVEIPPDAQVVDVSGKFILPGLADMHTHLGIGVMNPTPEDWNLQNNLARLLGWGVTLTFDPGLPSLEEFAALTRLARQASAATPHFFGVGPLISAKDGWSAHSDFSPETPDAARRLVRELKQANVAAVKIIVDDMSWLTSRAFPVLHQTIAAAAIEEGHRQGLKVYAHAPLLPYAKALLRVGLDGLVHGIISDPVDDEFLRLMQQNQAIYNPTHTLYEACADLAGWVQRLAQFDQRQLIAPDVYASLTVPATVARWETHWDRTGYTKQQMPVLRENTKHVHQAGIPVIAGTDTGVPGVLAGVASLMEVALLVEAGLTTSDAIRTATLNAARMVDRIADLGTIEVGKLADLLILNADPLQDVRNVYQIHRIVKGGRIYEQGALLCC